MLSKIVILSSAPQELRQPVYYYKISPLTPSPRLRLPGSRQVDTTPFPEGTILVIVS